MYINKELKLVKAVSKDAMRPAMQNISFENGYLIATNGLILAIAPANDYEEDTNGLISKEAYEIARKSSTGLVKLNGNIELPIEGQTFKRPEHKFTCVYDVIPTAKPVISIALDAKLLLDLANSLGSKGKIKLDIIGEEKPIRAYTPEGFGIIMPCKNGKAGGEKTYNDFIIQPIIAKKIKAEIEALDRIKENWGRKNEKA